MARLTEEQRKAVEERLRSGGNLKADQKEAAKERLSAGAAATERVRDEIKKPSAGFFQSIKDAFNRRRAQVEESADLYGGGDQSLAESALQTAAAGVGIAGDVAFEGLRAVTPKPVKDALSGAISRVAETDVAQRLIKSGQEFAESNPRAARNLMAGAEVLSAIPAVKGASMGVSAAKKGVKAAGGALEKGGEAAMSIAKKAGESANLAAEGVRTGAQVAGDVLEVGKRGLEKTADVVRQIPRRSQAAAEAAKESSRILEEATPAVREAATAGFAVPKAAKIAAAPREEKAVMRKIKELADAQSKGAAVKDPADYAGSFLTKRLKEADEVRKEIGERLGVIASSLPEKSVRNAQESVVTSIQKLPGMKGVFVDEDGMLDFSKSLLKGDVNKGARDRVNSYWQQINGEDAFDLHQTRQVIFEEQGGKKAAQQVMTDTDDKVLDAFRKGLADALEEVSPDYKAVNKEYAQFAETLKNLRKFYRKTEGAADDILDERSAMLLRRLTSNAVSGQELKTYISELDTLLSGYGKKSAVDLETLQDFVNMLAREYPEMVNETGLAGQIDLGVRRAGGPKLTEMLDQAAGKALTTMTQNTPEFRRKIIDELLTE